ncbi:MAG: hypothetical protein FHK79_21980 [Pseudomonas sp.]|nr:MAG: hypothetical protein FHK79_21980 [Pseudomonas sp.]
MVGIVFPRPTVLLKALSPVETYRRTAETARLVRYAAAVVSG